MRDETRVAFVALGCAKNLVDSEKMLGQLAEAGCALTSDENEADVVVINTCGFLDASRVEADEFIQEVIQRKANGKHQRLVVAGCLVQRDGEALLSRHDGIDALVGVNNRDDLVDAVLGVGRAGRSVMKPTAASGNRIFRRSTAAAGGGRYTPQGTASSDRTVDIYLSDYHPFTQIDTARLRLTPRHYAYLRISEGCDQMCTFCTIPSIRGAMHCKPPELVLREARELAEDGAGELLLIGQDTTSYGLGPAPLSTGLAGLLRQLNGVDGLRWIRLMYVYPTVMTDEIMDAIADSDRVCNYIDIPLQHINDRVLKAMHRRIDRISTERLLSRIRDRIPGVAIRTTLIAGFPGETDKEFEELRRFVDEFRFDALGVFPYSNEPGTPAAKMDCQIPDGLIHERLDALMKTQQKVAFEEADRRIGSSMEVVIDGSDESGGLVGRHAGQAPSVDSVTRITNCDADPGELVEVQCTGRDGYDLMARPTRITLPVLHG